MEHLLLLTIFKVSIQIVNSGKNSDCPFQITNEIETSSWP